MQGRAVAQRGGKHPAGGSRSRLPGAVRGGGGAGEPGVCEVRAWPVWPRQQLREPVLRAHAAPLRRFSATGRVPHSPRHRHRTPEMRDQIAARDDPDGCHPSTTGRCRYPPSCIIRSASLARCSGGSESGSRVMTAHSGVVSGSRPSADQAANRVAAGEQANQPSLLAGHHDRADPLVAHHAAGQLDGRRFRKRDGCLILDNVAKCPI